MTTANKLTILRMILVPVFIALMLLCRSFVPALAVFLIASFTDFLDGEIARKCHQVSDFGKFMDPLADKLLVTSALVLFVQLGQMPGWAAIVIIAREFAVSGLRMIAASGGLVIAAAWSGKLKTGLSILSISLMLTPLCTAGGTLNTICIAVMLVTTVFSGVEYFAKNAAVLKVKK